MKLYILRVNFAVSRLYLNKPNFKKLREVYILVYSHEKGTCFKTCTIFGQYWVMRLSLQATMHKSTDSLWEMMQNTAVVLRLGIGVVDVKSRLRLQGAPDCTKTCSPKTECSRDKGRPAPGDMGVLRRVTSG